MAYPVQTKGYRIAKYEGIDVFRERMKNFSADSVQCTDHPTVIRIVTFKILDKNQLPR